MSYTYSIRAIDKIDAKPFILEIHYAKRTPSISFAYGLFRDEKLVGICTYGKPPSSTLIKGVCGEQWAPNVYELNRLCLLDNLPNEASRLVAGSFKLLPKPTIIVSYADTKQNHIGIIYQATNFIYTGLSAKFRDPVVKGLEHQHHTSYAHGLTNKQLKEKFGEENVYFIDRSRKHRYIKFLGSRSDKRSMMRDLRYKIEDYPKESVDNK
jgi:hypothetical protein